MSSRTRLAPKAHDCPRRSAWPGACWCFCRRTTMWACRRRFRLPSAMRCARGCRRWWAINPRAVAAASSCAPTAKIPPMPSWPEASLKLPAMSLLHQDLDLLQRVLRDLVGDHTQTISLDSMEQFQRLRAFGQEFMPAAAGKLQHYKGERPIFDLYSIDEEVAKALGRRRRWNC